VYPWVAVAIAVAPASFNNKSTNHLCHQECHPKCRHDDISFCQRQWSFTSLGASNKNDIGDMSGSSKRNSDGRSVYDMNFLEKLEMLKEYKAEYGHVKVPQTHPTLGNWVTTQRQRRKRNLLPEDRIMLLNQTGFLWSVSRTKQSQLKWDKKYQELKTFHDEYGHFKIPIRKKPSLFSWVAYQRQQYRLNQLADNRIAPLNKIGFSWASDGDDETARLYIGGRPKDDKKWNRKVVELKIFKAKNHHLEVPQKHPTLGKWASTQRQQYNFKKVGKHSHLTDAREKILNDLGFSWDNDNRRGQAPDHGRWNRKFEELKKYKAEHGDLNVPKDHLSLGLWVRTQRFQYKLKKESKQSFFTDEREAAMNEIGFCWDRRNEKWMTKFQELKAFQKEHGHLDVPIVYPTYRSLGLWVKNQRTQYRLRKEGKHSTLTDERMSALKEAGFQWKGTRLKKRK
jgi:hypothetical protein